MITIKSKNEIELMKRAGEVVARVHLRMEEIIEPGITIKTLNKEASDIISKAGAIPSFLNFPSSYGGIPFPGVICASVNNEVIHGMPSERKLSEGDIISIDVGAILNGYHGDAARTYPVGTISDVAFNLIQAAKDGFDAGMKVSVPGNRIRDISEAVQTIVESRNFSVVRDFVGHGIGTIMHEEPQVPNFVSRERGPRLADGMTLAIEPMVNAGTWKVEVQEDKWTVVTADGKWSSHHENTIAITDQGPLILTQIWS